MKSLLTITLISLFAQAIALGLLLTSAYAAEAITYTVQGTVWTDFNNNKAVDAGEPVAANVTLAFKQVVAASFGDFGVINEGVTYQGEAGEEFGVSVVRLVTTDADGQYWMPELESGIYNVWVNGAGNEENATVMIVGENPAVRSLSMDVPAAAQRVLMPMVVR